MNILKIGKLINKSHFSNGLSYFGFSRGCNVMEMDTLAVITELNQIYRRLEDKGLQIVTGMN